MGNRSRYLHNHIQLHPFFYFSVQSIWKEGYDDNIKSCHIIYLMNHYTRNSRVKPSYMTNRSLIWISLPFLFALRPHFLSMGISYINTYSAHFITYHHCVMMMMVVTVRIMSYSQYPRSILSFFQIMYISLFIYSSSNSNNIKVKWKTFFGTFKRITKTWRSVGNGMMAEKIRNRE